MFWKVRAMPGADETGDLRAANGEVEVLHRFQSAKGNAQIDALQNGALIDIAVRDHTAGGNGNEFGKHIRPPPFRNGYRA